MDHAFQATVEKHGEWYIGWVDSVPGAFSQERTLDKLVESLKEAVQLTLECNSGPVTPSIVKENIRIQVTNDPGNHE